MDAPNPSKGGVSSPSHSFSKRQKPRFLFSFLAIAFAILMVSLALSPAVMPAKADASWDTVLTGAAAGGLIATAVLPEFDGLSTLVGFGIGAFCTWLGGAMSGGLDQAAFDATAQGELANNSMNVYNEYFSIAHAEAQTLQNHYSALSYYFARQAENGALKLYQYQTAHGQSHVYNASYVLTAALDAGK